MAGRKANWTTRTMTPTERAWLAGLLEGEGCFYIRPGGRVEVLLEMTDKDVVQRAAGIIGRPHEPCSSMRHSRDGTRKRAYRIAVYGDNARSMAEQVYPFMGQRRQSKIREIVA